MSATSKQCFPSGVSVKRQFPKLGFMAHRLSLCAVLSFSFGWMTEGGLVAGDVLPNILAGTQQVKLTLVADNLHNINDGTVQMSPTGLFTDGSGRLFITTL